MLNMQKQEGGQCYPGLWTGGYHMKYTREERLDIGRRVYDGEINRFQAAAEYGISEQTARNYMRQYRFTNGLPAKEPGARIRWEESAPNPVVEDPGLEEYEAMTKEELIRELVRSKIREARQKKVTK